MPTLSVDCRRPLLVAEFDQLHRMLSWSITQPGLYVGTKVAWLEVRDSDLPIGIDPKKFIIEKMTDNGLTDAVGLITSRDVRANHRAQSVVEDVTADCLTTVGLSNAERVGSRFMRSFAQVGTINTLVHVTSPLSDAALLEAISIATQARTAAVIDGKVMRDEVAVTGTGTDCIVIAAPLGEPEVGFAGLHTALGQAVGAAVYKATRDGVHDWQCTVASGAS